MKSLLHELRVSALLTLVLALVACGAYPVVVWAGAQLLFKNRADGSLIRDSKGAIVGSALLAQSFTGERFFHPRPSAAGTGYDATSSGGTNLGPTSAKLADAIKAAVAAYRKENQLPDSAAVPADAVTSSASGLDPHISPANAELQAPRVARANGLAIAKVRELIARHTEGPDLGIFGDAAVNVLLLNLDLASASGGKDGHPADRSKDRM